jgi:integrase
VLVFRVPAALAKIFNRDLKAAGIVKRNDRGRTLDFHSLRTTLATFLIKGGVPLRTAQAAVRHSDPSLTAKVYTDPRLLEVAGAHTPSRLWLSARGRMSSENEPKQRAPTLTTFAPFHCPLH